MESFFITVSQSVSVYSKKPETSLDISNQEEFNGRDWLNSIRRAGRANGKRGCYPEIGKPPVAPGAHTTAALLEARPCQRHLVLSRNSGIPAPTSVADATTVPENALVLLCCFRHHRPRQTTKEKCLLFPPTFQAPPAFSTGRTSPEAAARESGKATGCLLTPLGYRELAGRERSLEPAETSSAHVPVS